MIRKINFPIKLKIILTITLLLIGSISFYLFYALNEFKEDKSAYIFDTSLTTAESISHQIYLSLNHNIQLTKILGSSYVNNHNTDFIKKLFNNNPANLELSIYKITNNKPEQILGLVDTVALRSNNLKNDFFLNYAKKHPISFNQIKTKNFYFKGYLNSKTLPHILIGVYDSITDHVFISRIRASKLLNLFAQNKIYDISIINNAGDDFLSSTNNNQDSTFFKKIIKNNSKNGVQELIYKNKKYLVAFSRIEQFDLVTTATINKAKAFLVAEILIKKSIYFSLLLTSIAVIVGIIFSKSITSSIEKLFNATKKVAQGDFKSKVTINSKDEIGALSDSFNFMSSEIVRYMEEMKEKIRLEKEVEVAKLVQTSFFPDNDLDYENIQISAYYEPASECGGDWWGNIHLGDKTILMIADATGHGVPAALLTATANCCASNIKQLLKISPQYIDSPSSMLQLFNQAVSDIGQQILMTFFIAVIDHNEKKIIFSNASHNPPIKITPSSDGTIEKKSLIPILSKPGPRLGENKNAVYTDNILTFNKNDSLIFFTDGILECTNQENKPWGNRNFLKTIINHMSNDYISAKDKIINEAKQFYNNTPLEDDITLVIAKLK